MKNAPAEVDPPVADKLSAAQIVHLQNLANSARVFYDNPMKQKCANLDETFNANNLGEGKAYEVLKCNGLYMPIADDDATSMFPAHPANFDAQTEACDKEFGQAQDWTFVANHFGGEFPKKDYNMA